MKYSNVIFCVLEIDNYMTLAKILKLTNFELDLLRESIVKTFCDSDFKWVIVIDGYFVDTVKENAKIFG